MPQTMCCDLRKCEFRTVLFKILNVPFVGKPIAVRRSDYHRAGSLFFGSTQLFNQLYWNRVAVVLPPFRILPKESGLGYVSAANMDSPCFEVDVFPSKSDEFSYS